MPFRLTVARRVNPAGSITMPPGGHVRRTAVRRRARRGQIPLSVMVALVAILIAALAASTYLGTSTKTIDGREEIVAWGITFLGEDVYSLARDFERQNPQYRVIISSTAERDTTSDSQRLLSAIAGGVPPDVVL